MADNYLEKKMEELRNGTAMRRYHAAGAAGSRRTGLQFSFPPKRVLLASSNPWVYEIAKLFVRSGSKVAVISDDSGQRERFSTDGGIRFYSLDGKSDFPERIAEFSDSHIPDQRIERMFNDILKVWRDIDILMVDIEKAPLILPLWKRHRERFPYVSDYVCRIIIFGETGFSEDELTDIDLSLHATFNKIVSADYAEDISALAAMLCLPGNSIVDGMTFEV